LTDSNPDITIALANQIRTKRGLAFFKAMIADSRVCRIVAIPRAEWAGVPRGTCDIYIDPEFHPNTATTAGRKDASTERVLAHEIGHAATGIEDTGPGRMDNVIANENPIVTELGLGARIYYEPPLWYWIVNPTSRLEKVRPR
jgi:hypothetical protein